MYLVETKCMNGFFENSMQKFCAKMFLGFEKIKQRAKKNLGKDFSGAKIFLTDPHYLELYYLGTSPK